jgi:hypothetical protein
MSMKSTSSPRRVYSRNGVVHTLYAGDTFGMKGDSQIQASADERLFVRIVGNGDGTITVTQRKPGKKGVSETWSKVRVPCHARA